MNREERAKDRDWCNRRGEELQTENCEARGVIIGVILGALGWSLFLLLVVMMPV